jgi:elongation of very long chain fatty acids protein 6
MPPFLSIVSTGNFPLDIHHHFFLRLFSYALFASTGRWFVAMNYCVHTIMYGYFALRAARIRVPRFAQILITVLQIIQMIAGCIVNLSALNYKQEGHPCTISTTNIKLSLALYASYFILFAHFFYTTYLRKDSRRKTKTRSD